jgi:hypothetical protein
MRKLWTFYEGWVSRETGRVDVENQGVEEALDYLDKKTETLGGESWWILAALAAFYAAAFALFLRLPGPTAGWLRQLEPARLSGAFFDH